MHCLYTRHDSDFSIRLLVRIIFRQLSHLQMLLYVHVASIGYPTKRGVSLWLFARVDVLYDSCFVMICGINYSFTGKQGAVSIRKTVLPGMAIPMLKIRRPNGRLIFNMEIAIRR